MLVLKRKKDQKFKAMFSYIVSFMRICLEHTDRHKRTDTHTNEQEKSVNKRKIWHMTCNVRLNLEDSVSGGKSGRKILCHPTCKMYLEWSDCANLCTLKEFRIRSKMRNGRSWRKQRNILETGCVTG